MSHFAVLVIDDTKLTEDRLKEILQPWHEFECTGDDDKYVIDVDVTDELMAEWNGKKEAVRLADGTVLSRYDDKLYFDMGVVEFGSKNRQFRLPDGATEIEILQSELSAAEGKTMDAFAKEYGGYEKKADGRFYRHTNPNKKWDWWAVGGRYADRLWLTSNGGRTNSAMVGDIDLAAMTRTRRRERKSFIAECCKDSGLTEAELEIACHEEGAAHVEWLALPEPRPRGNAYTEWLKVQGGNRAILASAKRCWELPEVGTMTFAEWLDASPPLTSFAIVKDGRWFERGSMGWWGAVSDEKDKDAWESEFKQMFEGLPQTAHIAIVDCHI